LLLFSINNSNNSKEFKVQSWKTEFVNVLLKSQKTKARRQKPKARSEKTKDKSSNKERATSNNFILHTSSNHLKPTFPEYWI